MGFSQDLRRVDGPRKRKSEAMITTKRNDTPGLLLLKLEAESLDVSNVGPFREEVAPLVAAGDGVVEIDCSALEFVDSSGVAAFLHVNKLLTEDRRPVRLSGVGAKVMTQLEMMHVHRSFDLKPRR
ncbi:MAG: STAS domain-containing protein [Akkermansiaceae bacterium]|jgi:anti-anti-sigma factor|nr:STAS domain-containing protein [Akkermansiaceae bacterium]